MWSKGEISLLKFSVYFVIVMLAVVAALGGMKGKITSKKVILLLDEKDNEWKKRGLKDEEIEKHLLNCVNIISYIKISEYTEKELLAKCRRILENEEKFISFD